MSSLPKCGDRPSLPHRPRHAQTRRTSYPDGSPAHKRSSKSEYNDASEWPEWTDEDVLACAVPAADWPAWTDRVAFAPVPTLFDRDGITTGTEQGGG